MHEECFLYTNKGYRQLLHSACIVTVQQLWGLRGKLRWGKCVRNNCGNCSGYQTAIVCEFSVVTRIKAAGMQIWPITSVWRWHQ